MFDEDFTALAACVDEALDTIDLYVVETPATRIYCATEEDARDKVLAFALVERVAVVTREEVPSDLVWTQNDGWIRIEERVA
jgi:hypothetical protein